MSLLAAEAAYRGGRGWLEEVKHYVRENVDYTRDFLKNSIPRMQLVEPESTYLLWLDCRGYFLSDEELARIVIEDAGLWLDQGTLFGPDGSGFLRMNIACPRATLKEGLTRLAAAFQKVEEKLQKKRTQKLSNL
jgi:cysteine-S-conjugate beta-lyase